MIKSVRNNIGVFYKTYATPYLKKQPPYNFFQTRLTASSTPHALTAKSIKPQESSSSSLQVLYPLLALSLYGLQNKTECTDTDSKDSISITQKTPISLNSNSTPLQEPTIEEMIIEAKSFCEARKAGKIDPKKTHIPFLTNAIQCNFTTLFPEEKIAEYDLETKLDIENFRKEMIERIETKTVTYEWWFCFNLRLSILATPLPYHLKLKINVFKIDIVNLIKNNSWKNYNDTISAELFAMFDQSEYFLFPTTMGELSIHGMNQTFATNLWIIGLINSPLMTDGSLFYPCDFFLHDMIHLSLHKSFLNLYTPSFNKMIPIKEKFLQIRTHLESLKDPKMTSLIKLLDFVFFHLWHESFNGIPQLLEKKILPISSESNISIPEISRSDWYLDHYPDAKEFGVSSLYDLHNLGLSILELFFNSSTLPSAENLQKDIENLIKMLLEDKKIVNPSVEFWIYTNLTKVTLNTKQLDLYNEIVRAINTKNTAIYKSLLVRIKKAGPELNDVIKDYKIDQVLEYGLRTTSNKKPSSWFSFIR